MVNVRMRVERSENEHFLPKSISPSTKPLAVDVEGNGIIESHPEGMNRLVAAPSQGIRALFDACEVCGAVFDSCECFSTDNGVQWFSTGSP